MKIGIIGGGVVGQATARSWLEHCEEVRCYDVVKERRTHDLYDVMACDFIFVCLPTPQMVGSLECDTTKVEGFFDGINLHYRESNLVLRSTVPIGFTRRVRDKYNLPNLVHSPEFLTARCAATDAQMPSRNIVGTPHEEGRLVWPEVTFKLREMYEGRFPGIPCLLMSSDESEAVKLFLNSFFAVKVAYFNEVYTLSQELGLNWERVRAGILSDGRVSHSHTMVPGPDGKRGFGGTCLPKDIASLVAQIIVANQVPYVTAAAASRNRIDRREE